MLLKGRMTGRKVSSAAASQRVAALTTEVRRARRGHREKYLPRPTCKRERPLVVLLKMCRTLWFFAFYNLWRLVREAKSDK